jgi:perosamine synthetase
MGHRYIGVGTLKISSIQKKYVNQALDNNRLSYGPFTKKLESEFSRLHGCNFGIMSNSGTSALHIALAALKEIHKWEDNDEVLIPSVTFVATANIVLHNKMKPVIVDVERDYYGMDPKLIGKKITKKTRAIIPVHLFGMPCDMGPIKKLADDNNLKIIEDSAETMFSSYDGKMVGSLGDIGCFSTYVAHLIVSGVGGLNTTNNPEYATKLRSLMNHGRDSIYFSIDDSKNKNQEEMKEIISRRFKFISLGHSFRVTEMEAALGIGQLENWKSMIDKRRKNANYLIEGLKYLDNKIQLPTIRPGSEHSFMMFPIVLRNEKKEKIVNYLEKKCIETRDMLPLTNQPIYKEILRLKEEDFPIAKWINDSGFYVGCHQDINEEDLDYMIETIKEYFK